MYRMGPPSCLISGFTMVYGRYNYSQWGFKPTCHWAGTIL